MRFFPLVPLLTRALGAVLLNHDGVALIVVVNASALVFGEVPLGIIPAGSGNGLANELGVSRRPERAIAQALASEGRLIDVGEIDKIDFGHRIAHEVAASVSTHVAALGAKDFQSREAASQALLKLREKSFAELLKAAKRSSFLLAKKRRCCGSSASSTLWQHFRSIPNLSAALMVASIRLRITLWLLAVMPTFLPRHTSSQIMRAPVKVLPAPGGP